MTDTQPGPVPTHRMLAGSHERAGGPECRCGASWDKFSDRCAAQVPVTDTQPAPTVPDEAVSAAAEIMSASGYRTLLTNVDYWTEMARTALTAAAPFIVAANQPDAAEVERLRAQRDAALHFSRAKEKQDNGDIFGAGWDSAMAAISTMLAGDATP